MDAVIVDDKPSNVSVVDFGEFSIVFVVRDVEIKLESTFVWCVDVEGWISDDLYIKKKKI